MTVGHFDYVKLDKELAVKHEFYKQKFVELDASLNLLSSSREKSLVVTHLEEAFLWVSKALRHEQISKNNLAEINEECKHG